MIKTYFPAKYTDRLIGVRGQKIIIIILNTHCYILLHYWYHMNTVIFFYQTTSKEYAIY